MSMSADVEAVAPRPSPAAQLKRATQNKWVQRAIVWGALLLLYEIAATAAGDFYLPRLGPLAGGFVDIIQDGRLGTIADSMRQLAVGFGLAALVGIPLGLLMGRVRLVDYVVGMYVNALFVTSLVAVLPLLIILFGVEFRFRVAVVFLFAVFFIIVNSAAGGRAADRRLIRTAEAFSASRLRIFWSVVLPSGLPHVFVGLRLGLANAFSGMILAEIWVSRGTGAVLEGLGRNRDLPKFLAMILLITAIAAALAWAIKYAERRLMPWAEEVNRRV
jgi:ABC-type nitrate/sulfonate/bicarbonate transport system permease component